MDFDLIHKTILCDYYCCANKLIKRHANCVKKCKENISRFLSWHVLNVPFSRTRFIIQIIITRCMHSRPVDKLNFELFFESAKSSSLSCQSAIEWVPFYSHTWNIPWMIYFKWWDGTWTTILFVLIKFDGTWGR